MRRSCLIFGVGGWLALAGGGCYSGVTGGFGNQPDEEPDADEGESGNDDDGGDTGDGGPEASCAEPKVAPTPLRRLTRLEYDNSVRHLLLDDSRPSESFTPDEAIAGYAANAVAPISALQLDEYFSAAEDLAERAVSEQWDAVVGCDAAEPACVPGFVERFGLRALRRPLSADEQAGYVALYEASAAEQDPTAAVQTVIEAMLMSPSFLYHVEPMPLPVDGSAAPIDDFAMASRLSFFVWASTPDDELLDLAAAGMLSDAQVLEDQVRRLLDDEEATAAAVGSFHRQWLNIGAVADLTKDPDLFPEWDLALAQSMETETLRFAEEVVLRGDASLRTLLTASWSVIDADLATLYGVDGPATGFAVTELDPDERAGILTHASFLASNAHAADTSWTLRGKFVRERLLCGVLAPPPAIAEDAAPKDPDRATDPNCGGCHMQMDPIGTGLDGYSAIGGFRLIDEEGDVVDESGSIADVPEIGSFEGAIELANALADAPGVGNCVATQWLRFATRRKETPQDLCAVTELRESFAQSNQNIRELIVAIALSDTFRYAAAVTE